MRPLQSVNITFDIFSVSKENTNTNQFVTHSVREYVFYVFFRFQKT